MTSAIIQFFAENYLPLVSLTCLLHLTLTDKSFSKSIRHTLLSLVITVFCMLILNFIDLYIEKQGVTPPGQTHPYYLLRFVCAALGYALRPITLYYCVLLLYTFSRRTVILLAIPGLINAVLGISSLMTGWLFTITPDNCWHEGPCRRLYFFLCALYLLLMVFFLIYNWKKTGIPERVAQFFVIICIFLGSLFDALFTTHTLMLTIVGAFIMYYLFIHVQQSNATISSKDTLLESQRHALLYSQIQPHFIYNTLNVIYALCFKDPPLAGKTILNFSSYLRNNLDLGNSSEMIPVEKELEHTHRFTDLELLRFPTLTVNYDIRDGGYEVPFLVIQPMVENAIRHGVRGMEDGTVSISLYRETADGRDFHVIVIHDNGTGVSRANRSLGEHHGIGIANVRSRIEKLVGGRFGIVMSNESGTTVTMRLPVTK